MRFLLINPNTSTHITQRLAASAQGALAPEDELTAVTAATGLDAFTQLLEPFVSIRSTPMTDALCLDGLRRAAKALPKAWRDGRDLAARSEMSLASLYGGIALANAGRLGKYGA